MSEEPKPVDVRFAELDADRDSPVEAGNERPGRPERTAVPTLDLEELGLKVDVTDGHLKQLLTRRLESVTAVYATINTITKDLTVFKPKVPESLPPVLAGRFLNPDGSPAAQVRVRALEPTSPTTTTDGSTFQIQLPWPNPQVVTDARGAFRLNLPPRPLPDDGLRLAVHGGNRIVEYGLRRSDLVAGAGDLGVLPLDEPVLPLPRSVVSQLGDLVLPTGEDDVASHPEEFASQAPVFSLGEGDCARSFRSNAGAVDRFGYAMLVRLIAPELSGRRLANRVGSDGRSVLLSSSTSGLTRYVSPEQLIQAMGSLGSWEIVGRTPIEAPVDVESFLDVVQRDPLAVPKAATLGIGYVVKMHQLWIPAGYSLGDLAYSLPLAPGEQQRIAVSDERETLSVREQETLTADEFQRYTEAADSSTNSVFRSAFDESASGGSTMRTRSEAGAFGGGLAAGGIFGSIVAGLGIGGGYSDSTTTGSTSSWQNSSRDYVSNASQDFHSSLARAASARRTANRTSVRLATASERREVVTKVITNHNHNHALTMQYWEVLRHFAVTSKVDDVQLVCFVPFEVIAFIPPGVPRTLPAGAYTRDALLLRYTALLRHHDVIRSRLGLRPEFNHALRVLQSFAGDPTMTVQSATGSAQDIVNVTLQGTFLPFEDVYVTAISTSGARVGPVRMSGTSASVTAGVTSKAGLLELLRSRRANSSTAETRTATLALPAYLSQSNLARFEFSRGFRPFSYRLSLPSGLDFTDLLAYLTEGSKLDVTMGSDELERELSGPVVSDPLARIGSADLLESYNGPGGTDIMPVVMPVAAKRLPPVLAFADLLRIEALLRHVVENTVEYSKAVWASLTQEERAIMLERFTIGVPSGGLPDAADEVPLLNCVANQVLGFFGNAAVMPFFIPPQLAAQVGYTSRDVQEALLRFHRQAYHPAQSSITLPARGVLGEAVLGSCDSSEKIDLTRFWNWQDSPPDTATDPAAAAGALNGGNQLVGPAGVQAPSVLQPGVASMVNINQGPAALTPADLAAALIKSLPESNLPKDLTGIAQLAEQMKIQTHTTADSLNKTISEASGLAKEAMKVLPEAIKAKNSGASAGAGGQGGGSGSTGGSSDGGGSGGGTGGGGTGGGGTGGGGDGGGGVPVDAGPAPSL